MAKYDPTIIQKFADKLYSQANLIIILYLLIGAGLGAAGGYALRATLPGDPTVIAAVVCGMIGLALGLQRSFMLKVQAQTALCQIQIEENTRQQTQLMRAAASQAEMGRRS